MDQVTLVKNRYRLEQWTQLIQNCQSSGMRVEDWCQTNGVTRDAYYYWLRKIRKVACKSLTTAETPTVFQRVEVKTPVADNRASVFIHLPTATLEVQNGALQQTVEAVLLALKTIC